MSLKGKIQVFELWSDKVADMHLTSKFLTDLTHAIGMTPHGYPQVIPYPTENLGNTVIALTKLPYTAYQPLYESYIVFDNWPELNYANLVVNSCKPYDSAIIKDFISRYFETTAIIAHEPLTYNGERP